MGKVHVPSALQPWGQALARATPRAWPTMQDLVISFTGQDTFGLLFIYVESRFSSLSHNHTASKLGLN